MKRFIKLLYTVKYLKLSQLFFYIYRRKFSARHIQVDPDIKINTSFVLSPTIAVCGGYISEAAFCFLNQQKHFGAAIDWSASGLPRLWAYNLHYFDALRNDTISHQQKRRLVEDWAANNPQNSQPGWEPFTASLRVVNWITFFSSQQKFSSHELMASLYLQVSWLEKNDERHILANHYFENLKALLFAGVYFEGEDARRWRTRAICELTLQLKEQVLADGGHYERSPQYHGLMLENYLDIYNLVCSNADHFDASFASLVRATAVAGLQFLADIVFPDKKIPLFNDSAFGIAPDVDDLVEYARRLGIEISEAPQPDIKHIIDKPESGLYGVRSGSDMLIMDCGDIGPSYQPGHTHCDFLSYELMKDGRRVVVDTGVSEYAPGERRHYLRSTSAHNTVSINGLEQSEIWGEFRVARRAKKEKAAILRSGENIDISGTYSGFYDTGLGLKPGYRHGRKINVKLDKGRFCSIAVVDNITALGNSKRPTTVSNYIHLHPDISVDVLETRFFKLNLDGRVIASLAIELVGELDEHCQRSLDTTIVDSIYCPEFGLTQNNKCIEIKLKSMLPVTLSYTIDFLSK